MGNFETMQMNVCHIPSTSNFLVCQNLSTGIDDISTKCGDPIALKSPKIYLIEPRPNSGVLLGAAPGVLLRIGVSHIIKL